jgi:mannose-6-phosphate isomerase-like protein (cupin superfamily)
VGRGEGAASFVSFAADAGQRLALPVRTFLKGKSAWTGGAYCVTDALLPPRILVAPHRHEVEDQVTIVVSGTVGVWVDGEEEILTPGAYSFRAAGTVHAVFNPGDEPAHAFELTSPGESYEAYMVELGELMAASAPSSQIQELARGAGVTFVDGIAEELCARHGLDPGAALLR